MSKLTVLFVTQFIPSDVGHGGNHRSYQILHDLRSAVGEANVILVSFSKWQEAQRFPANPIARWMKKIRRGLTYYSENPYKLLAYTQYSTRRYAEPGFISHYQAIIQEILPPAVCVIEHTGFANLISINSHYGIPTIASPENIESFDLSFGRERQRNSWLNYSRAIDFANEYKVLAQCADRLFISRVETGLIGGLGLSAQYYPYLPVGSIRVHLDSIRKNRATQKTDAGLFLLLGSAIHPSTSESFNWFLQNVTRDGLPQGIRVVVIGTGTDKLLLSADQQVAGMDFKGWVEQNELDDWLTRANAVLLPQFWGFGALTRLLEMSCANIPVVTNHHPTWALDLPPGVEVVDDDWTAWCSKMTQLRERSQSQSLGSNDYVSWEHVQPDTLRNLIAALEYKQ